jgi:hypothetical protein
VGAEERSQLGEEEPLVAEHAGLEVCLMPFTQQDVDNLKQAIADGRGAKTLTFADQTITFHSVDEMLKLLTAMQADVTVAASTTGSRTRLAATSKGV